jgi:hypothetical protein
MARCEHLPKRRELLDALLLSMRLAMEVGAFRSFRAYAHVTEQVAPISRGWRC